MRNNTKRLGIPDQKEQGESAVKSSADFSFVLSTEFVDLPTKGRFYPEGHPLHDCEKVEIKHMTAKEEDMLVSNSFSQEFNPLGSIFSSVILNKEIDPLSMLISDRNAVLYTLRKISYGNDYEVRPTCAECKKTFHQIFNLEDCIKVSEGNISPDFTKTGYGTLIFKTEKTKADVEFRLLNGYDESYLLKLQKEFLAENKAINYNEFILNSSIVAVNDSEELVPQYIDEAPISEVHQLREAILEITPTVKIIGVKDCIHCGHTEEAEIPIGLSFFRFNS
jgi:hypothetical protein